MAQVHGQLKTWHKVTVDFAGPQSSEAAATFRDYRLDVSFTNQKTGETFVAPGYFAADGNAAETGATSGNVWRVHFNPPSQGDWTYTASFRTGTDVAASSKSSVGQPLAGFDGQSGSFKVGPTDKTGEDFRAKGMLEYTGEHYLRHAGTGEPFLKGGADSPENFLAYYQFDNTQDAGGLDVPTADGLHHYTPHVGDWRPGDPTWQGGKGKGIIGSVNYLADQGVNSQYFITMNVQGDGRDVWPWVSPNARTTYDVSKLAQWEIVFNHMDERGVMMQVLTQETENDQLLNSGNLGVERAVYYRELIARFGHHNGVVWNLGEENTNTTTQLKSFANYFEAVDPYDHAVVVHSKVSPDQQDALYKPLLGHPGFDGASLQTRNAAADVARWVNGSEAAGRPWMVNMDEWGTAQEGVVPDGASGSSANHAQAREAMWSSLLAGSAGVEWYFGYSHPHSDITLEDFGSRESVWGWTDYALDFFRAHLPFTEMQSADALTPNTADYVFAKPGEVYAIYLPAGGSTSLDLNGQTGTYDVEWYDPRNGGALKDGTVTQVTGGGVRSLGQAPSNTAKDWTVLVRHTEGPPPGGTQGPTDLDVAPKSFDEEVAYSGTLSASDPDSTSFTFALLNDPSGLFEIQNTNKLVLTQPIDFENLPTGFTDQNNGTAKITLMLEARDEADNARSEAVTLLVKDVAENPPPDNEPPDNEPPDNEPPDNEPPTGPITLVAKAGILDGTASPQKWGADVTISALAANGNTAVITHSTDGFGVKGGRFGTQIDHIPANNTSEQFVLEFSGPVQDVVLRFGRMNPDELAGKRETGTWTAFDAAGNQVAKGVLDPAGATKVAKWTYDIPIDTGGKPFAELLLKPTGYNNGTSGAPNGDSSDFALKQLTYTSVEGTPTPSPQPPIDVDVTPKSFDEEMAYSGTLSASDPDSTAFTFALLNDPSGLFEIQNTNQLVLTQPIDFENLPTGFTDQNNGTAKTTLMLEARDEADNARSEAVTLLVKDVPENPPPDNEPPNSQTPTDPVTLVARAGVLDGTASPQKWGADVTISALAANGNAAAIAHSTDGFGVKGGRFGTQIDHIPTSNTSEQFILEFSGPVQDLALRFGRMNPDELAGNRETGTWTAFDAAGNQVAKGALDPADGTKVAKWTYDLAIDAGGKSFTELLLEPTGYNGGTTGAANGDSSDFALKQLTYTYADDEDSMLVGSGFDDGLVDSVVIA